MYPTPFLFNTLWMNAYINSGRKGGTVVKAVVGESWFKSRCRLLMLVGLVLGSLHGEGFFRVLRSFSSNNLVSLGRKRWIHKQSQKKIEMF